MNRSRSRSNHEPRPASTQLPGRNPTTPGQNRSRWTPPAAILLLACGVLSIAQQPQNSQQNNQQNNGTQANDPGPGRAWAIAGPIPISVAQPGQANLDAANAERRKQLAEDSARLVKLATDLKAEVDKTTKDTLSLSVIRKADEIEKLAHSVKEKMKLTAAAN